jgi:hypothetical protein
MIPVLSLLLKGWLQSSRVADLPKVVNRIEQQMQNAVPWPFVQWLIPAENDIAFADMVLTLCRCMISDSLARLVKVI